jgi:phosphohistidine phosphatase SixA
MEQVNEPSTKLRTIVVFSMLFAVLGAVVVFAYFTTFSRPVTTVILVRHAEKKIEPNNQDPDLAPEGVERAQEIARVFGEAGHKHDLRDATQAHPTDGQASLRSHRRPQSLCSRRIKPDEIVNQIETTNRGQTVFVAGHNNTVPAIVSSLSGETYPVFRKANTTTFTS